MQKTFTADELSEYIKEKSNFVLATTTKDVGTVPAGTKLWFGIVLNEKNTEGLSSFVNKNQEFKYDFDYSWNSRWHKDTELRFIVEEEEPEATPMKTRTMDEIISDYEKTNCQIKELQDKKKKIGQELISRFESDQKICD